jgi:hypothetical protein
LPHDSVSVDASFALHGRSAAGTGNDRTWLARFPAGGEGLPVGGMLFHVGDSRFRLICLMGYEIVGMLVVVHGVQYGECRENEYG